MPRHRVPCERVDRVQGCRRVAGSAPQPCLYRHPLGEHDADAEPPPGGVQHEPRCPVREVLLGGTGIRPVDVQSNAVGDPLDDQLVRQLQQREQGFDAMES